MAPNLLIRGGDGVVVMVRTLIAAPALRRQ
jgi:hypothetical protein